VLPSAAAYIPLDSLRRQTLADTDLPQAQVDTIRLKLLKIGARVVCSVRRVVLHLAEGYPLKDLFIRVLGYLRALTAFSPASGGGRQNPSGESGVRGSCAPGTARQAIYRYPIPQSRRHQRLPTPMKYAG